MTREHIQLNASFLPTTQKIQKHFFFLLLPVFFALHNLKLESKSDWILKCHSSYRAADLWREHIRDVTHQSASAQLCGQQEFLACGSSPLFQLSEQHNALLNPPTGTLGSLGWLCKTHGDTESLRHSLLINQSEVGSNTRQHSHDHEERCIGAGYLDFPTGWEYLFLMFMLMLNFYYKVIDNDN